MRVAAFAPNRRRLHPIGAVLRAGFLVKEHPGHAFRIALERQRAIFQVRQQDRSDAHVVIDHLPLGEAGCGIEDLVQIGDGQLLSLDVDRRFRTLCHEDLLSMDADDSQESAARHNITRCHYIQTLAMDQIDDKRFQERRRFHEPKLPVCSSEPPVFPEEQKKLFQDVLRFMNEKQIPYVVSGTFALHEHTGIWRQTKDIDLFVTAADMRRALALFKDAGYETWVKDPVWLGKVTRGKYFVDLITGMSNAVMQVDKTWIERGVPSEVLGVLARVLGPEE